MVPYATCQLVKDLIDEHKIGRERSNQADAIFYSKFLDYEDLDKIPANFLSEWKSARSWFVRHAHLRRDPFPEYVSSELESNFRIVDYLLHVAATSEFGRLKAIDEILEEANG